MITEYNDICVICGKPKQETHHLVFGRGMRELSDKDGLMIPLCSECHQSIHHNGVAGAMSKIIGQLQWEMDEITSEQLTNRENARENFRKRYGRSYL